MPADKLIGRLQGVKERGPGKWIAQCPAHDDKSPSLSIIEKADGRVLIHCFVGCSSSAVLDAVNLTFYDLIPEPLGEYLPPIQRPHQHAANDVLKVMAHEALVVAIVAEQIAIGREFDNADLDRIAVACVRLREAADLT